MCTWIPVTLPVESRDAKGCLGRIVHPNTWPLGIWAGGLGLFLSQQLQTSPLKSVS